MGLSPIDIFQPFEMEGAKAIIAAVSGGSDSLAMLFLLKDYLASLEHPPSLIAVTVDHRLREESTREAENVGVLCDKHGIAHRIVTWNDPKPSKGLLAGARNARYRLLMEAAREAGAQIIVTGHTQDDQIETFLMRKERSHHAEARGLAAMAARSWLEGMRLEDSAELIRPLLSVSRQALREVLQKKAISWIDDPSNSNTDYERPRVRLGGAAKADGQIVLAQIALARAARKRDNAALVAALADPNSLRIDDCGAMEIDPAIYAALPETVQALFSGVVTSVAGGRRFLPGHAERLRIARLLAGEGKTEKLTMLGALIAQGKADLPHRFGRERRNLPVNPLNADKTCIWDGRFRLRNTGKISYEVAAPGRQVIADFLSAHGGEALGSRQREALLVLPALFKNDKLAALPFWPLSGIPEGVTIERHFALFDHVLPGYDFALAAAVEERIGRECGPIV
ncbi:tRNA lysidine(34) synthetase TilS [Brucella sp. BE17]|uniref:tRNA lysidine(34) synthetase TilS n=1 Tax=Brucella sp. BE17 TaxID=3142977 RepID=UPI0031BB6120